MSSPSVAHTLSDAGSPERAQLWRQLAAQLHGPLCVHVAGCELAQASALSLPSAAHLRLTPLVATAAADIALLGAHAVLWPTPWLSALGQREREAMDLLQSWWPARRAVVLTGYDALELSVDDPEAEARSVRERVESLVGEGWELIDASELPAWLERLGADAGPIAADRLERVGELLLQDLRRELTAREAQQRLVLRRAQDHLDARQAVAQQQHERTLRLRHAIAATLRHHVESLVIDLRDRFARLERDLPAEVDAVPASVNLHTVLPAWVELVLRHEVSEAVSTWRESLTADLQAVDVGHAPPELATPLVGVSTRGGGDWPLRLAFGAALGSGVALLLTGLWLPGVAALATGITGHPLLARLRAPAQRASLTERARDALRELCVDVETDLQAQLQRTLDELEQDAPPPRVPDDELLPLRAALRTTQQRLLLLPGWPPA